MDSTTSFGRLKPVFPVLYLTIFVYTVVYMYVSYLDGVAPPIVQGVVGKTNQNTVLIITYIFAFFLCLYDIIYYVRLEVFEHHHKLKSNIRPITVFFEFTIRFILVGIVALKIIEYNVLNDLFVFSAIMSFIISIWLIYLKFFNIDRVGLVDLGPNIMILLLSSTAAYYSSAPERQIKNAIIVVSVSLLLSIILAAGVIYILFRFGKDMFELTRDFLSK